MILKDKVKIVLSIGHLKEKLNFDVNDLCKLSADDLRWQVDYAISQVCVKHIFFM